MKQNNYIISARKYRPTQFEDVVGQSHITTTLKNAIKNNKLAQAFLFCGPRGIGKTTCARILAKSINCLERTSESEPCNKCSSCSSFNKNASFNIHELDAASNNSVDDIRNLVEQVRYSPQAGKYKIYIIDEVHMLSNAAFNAFLKTLEEPPSYAIFILATTEKHKIISTILSRCQIFDFNRISSKDIFNHLKNISIKEKIEADNEALDIISKKADGALRDALSMFDLIATFDEGNKITYKSTIDNLNILDYDYYFKIVENLINSKISELLLIFNKIIEEGFDGLNFIVGLSEHFRKLMVVKYSEVLYQSEMSDELKNRYLQQSQKLDNQYIIEALNIAGKCELDYKMSKNKRLCIELSLINMTKNQIHKNDISNLSTLDNQKKKSSPELNSAKTAQIDRNLSSKNKEELVPNSDIIIKENIEDINPNLTNANQAKVKLVANITNKNSLEQKEIDTKIDSVKNNDLDLNDLIKEIDDEEKKKETKKIKSTLKIIDLKKISETLKKQNVNIKEEENQKTKNDNNIILPPENIEEVWKQFLDKLKMKGQLTEFNILKNYEIKENTLTIIVNSEMQKEIFDEIKQEIKIYIESKIKNLNLKLECLIKTETKIDVPYTNKEKFKYLAEKNNNLYILDEKLELDFDI
ncbi:MAG: DNA polymerase III subunit gamma/tau [Bacteroidetes bacterium]|nr:DNA polymerase III subunit gamma/tau [Bacteroidota bacterium]